MVVKSELERLGLPYGKIDLGEVEIIGGITADQHDRLRVALQESGLELMHDHKEILIARIKAVIVEMVHYASEVPKTNFSNYLSERLNYNYTYLSNLFAEVTGTTIEHFIIAHKVERVKELLIYNELNLTQISYKLNYSSVAHLSNQFRKVTGLTPTAYKKLKHKKRGTLDDM
jgi:YesN/AraC family two-component response regulator